MLSVSIPNKVVTINDCAFAVNNLSSIMIPSSVVSIGEKSFFNNHLTSFDIQISSTTSIGAFAFDGQFGHLIIPDDVIRIDEEYFLYLDLISIAIGNNVESIGDFAFYYNQISSVILGNSVQTIGVGAFKSNQISFLAIGTNVQDVGNEAFSLNKLTSVSIPSTVVSIGDKTFFNNHISSYEVESSNTSIGPYAFAGQFGHLVIPDDVTSIEDTSFMEFNLISVTIGNNVKTIGKMAFYYNQVSSLIIGDSVEVIGPYSFGRNDLSSVIIPPNVTRIGRFAFANNKNVCFVYMGAKFLKNKIDDDYVDDDRTDDLKDDDDHYYFADDINDDDNLAYPECGTSITTNTPTPSPTRRPTITLGRPAKRIKFRNDRGGEDKPSPPAFAAFINSEETTDRSPDANIEYHCFEHEARYVRGTYGMRGYFEGKLDGHTAYVNFFEITNDGETLVPTTGSAAITYSEDWSSVDGPFWSTGSSTMPGSWGSWGALESCVNCFPSDMSMKRIRKEKCLWSDNEHSHFERLPDLSDRIMGSEQTANTWFDIGYGPRDTSGVMVGSYHYTYTEQQCSDWSYDCSGQGFDEVGRYGSHSVSANVKGGRILASDLQISSGPLSGHIGSGLYLIFNYEDGSVGYTGYFCAADWIETSTSTSSTSTSTSGSTNGSIGNMKLVLVDCAYDAGDEMAADSNQAVHLLGAGYGNLWNIYSMEWQRLSHFFQLLTISTN